MRERFSDTAPVIPNRARRSIAAAMPSHAPAKQEDPADDVEVYANGVAFDVVKGWLGRAGEDLEFDQWFGVEDVDADRPARHCLLYTSPRPRDQRGSRMPSSA